MSIHSTEFLRQYDEFTQGGGDPVTVEIYSGSLRCGRVIQDHPGPEVTAWVCGVEASFEARGVGAGFMACPEHLYRAVKGATAQVIAECS